MKVLLSFCLVISFATPLCLVHCEPLSPITPTQTDDVDGIYFVEFDSVPEVVTRNTTARVRYQCPRACRVRLEVVLTTPHEIEQLVFRRTWTSVKNPGTPRVRMVPLNFPPAIIYKQDFSRRHSIDAREVMIRALLTDIDTHVTETHPRAGEYLGSLAHTFKLLRTVPPAERPVQPHTMCTSWGAELMWQLTKGRIHQCPFESDVVDVTQFPLVSTGERYGVIRTFQPFVNRELETARYHNMEHPRVAVSVWIYLLNWCSGMRCGIIKHVNEFSNFGTPLIMLTDTGDIVVQVRLASRIEQAFTAHTALPIQTWIRLDCYVQYAQVKLQVNYETASGGKVDAVHVYDFHGDILCNDTSGHLVIGGSRLMEGILGYFGPVRYYRLGTEEVINPLSPAKTLEDLDKFHGQCEEVKLVMEGFMYELNVHRDISSQDQCHSYYKLQMIRYGQMTCAQMLHWDFQKKYQPVFKLIETHEDLMPGEWNSVAALRLGSQFFEDAVSRIAKGEPVAGPEPTLSPIALLKVSSCLGHHQASLLLATVHLAGFGVPVDLQQGHVYSLIGAGADDRLALLHLGYKHAYGLDGFPRDHAVAYSYYINIGRQTSIDKDRVEDPQQYITDPIHISDTEELKTQMGETDDVVQYIKLQAERGDIESQKHLAKILFWGLNGVSKDVGSAVKWFAQSAMQMTDARAIYDYSILLVKGQGVKKNLTLGLQLMEKAAAMGSDEALNGLGWYYSTIAKDPKRALKYFQQAAQNGSSDAMFNVGVYHLQGHPIRNETAAFECFLNASYGGHVDGAIEAAFYLTAGKLPGVSRDPEKAGILLKRISEQNGHLGYANRRALQAYLQGSWDEALVRFAMLAETGLEAAQSNAAHLCEELNHSSVCHWRYYNQSTYNYAPHYAGLLKMGDLFIEHHDGLADGMSLAMEMYAKAALAGSPQGIYNLAVLIEGGGDIPQSILNNMRVPAERRLDNTAIVQHLLQSCVEFAEEREEGALSPCALALLRVNIQTAWRGFTQDTLQLALAYGMLGGLVIVVAYVIEQITLGRDAAIPARQRDGALAGSRDSAPVHPADRRESGEMDGTSQREMGSLRVNPSDETALPGLWWRQRERALQEGTDVVVTVAGVCLCVLGAMLLSHLL
ncbi:protein sel-1 homolog 3 [Clupea harengus]|uniref:Protein sel-1 homolog 3 n=1 Tax=Clupea harengus TaxID=7950 RepID=A0A6P8G6X3_CLUHA|nr:protein sel-1 homolog 3 [Clupea harengus]